MIRIDLSPPDFIHVPQAPRIERRTFCTRTADNEWHMWTAGSITSDGERLGLSNHTWSHLDAPFHLLPQGPTFEQLDPRHYLALDARLVDLTSSDTGRRETVNGVNYHTRVDVADLPADLDAFEAVLFVTGFAELYASRYPMQAGADGHYPHVTREAAERLAGVHATPRGRHRRPELRQARDQRGRPSRVARPHPVADSVARDAHLRAPARSRPAAASARAAHDRAAAGIRPGRRRSSFERLRIRACTW